MDAQQLISLFYAYIGLISCLIIFIIFNRTLATKYKNMIDKRLCNVFIFFIIFCLIDSTWGFVGCFLASTSPAAYNAATYLFHSFAALSSLFISYYAISYFGLKGKTKNVFNIYRFALFAVQAAMIITNTIVEKFWFVIDSKGVYSTQHQYIRTIVFCLQFAQYMPLCIYAFIKGIQRMKDKKSPFLYFSGSLFLLIPFVFGLLQMFYPDGPFYSLGFAVFSVSIYAINITRQRESFLADFAKLEAQRKSHEEISKALKAAEDANNAKSKFLANMSHDIRTPINGIMGMTSLIENEEMSPKAREYIGKIEKASNHLLSLVNDVLDTSRIESKQAELINKEPMNVCAVVDNCGSIISGQILGRNLNFKINFLTTTPNANVYGDQLRVRQILINIIGNAVKFTPDKGSVFVDVSELSKTNDIVTYEFVIKDTGIGMSKEFMEHIFEPFSQEESGSRSNYQGTGLGMSITKQLVDLMKGTISVDSELGKGSTFRVTIPFVINEKEALPVETVVQSNVDVKGLNVLLVEDNDLNMEIAESILQTFGVNISKAKNGKEALDTFVNNKEGSFDIILMDIMMPIMNGYESTIAIRKSNKKDSKTIPIIAMTANAFEEDKKQATLVGMNAHISKPINFKLLKSEIYRLTKQGGKNN